MGYAVKITKKAEKDLHKIGGNAERLLLAWIEKHLEGCDNPRSIVGSKPLVGTENGWRYKVGNYRILATLLDNELIIDIVTVGHRQGVYDNMPKRM